MGGGFFCAHSSHVIDDGIDRNLGDFIYILANFRVKQHVHLLLQHAVLGAFGKMKQPFRNIELFVDMATAMPTMPTMAATVATARMAMTPLIPCIQYC